MSKEQKDILYRIIVDGPEKYGFDCGIWNSAIIVEVIQREFHVTYNPRYLCALVGKMKLCYQKGVFVEDGASYHRSQLFNKFKEEMLSQERLLTYRLPSYSPDKNPIEKLWRTTKRDATHCKYFPDFQDLRSAVIKAFNKYMEDATKVIATMTKLRAEAGLV